jgi:hypothetical protein
MKSMCRSIGFGICLLFLWFTAAQGEHTVEHRFTVHGYVYSDSGDPVPGTITIRDEKDRVLGVTEAARSGYYQIQLHLHSSNLNDRLFVQSEAGKKELIVKFDPNDMNSERKGELNFGKVPPPSGLKGNKSLLFGLTAVVAVGMYYIVSKRRKSKKHRVISKQKKQRQRK